MLGHVLMRTSATPSQIHKTRRISNNRAGHVCPRSLVQKQGMFCTCRNNYKKVRYLMDNFNNKYWRMIWINFLYCNNKILNATSKSSSSQRGLCCIRKKEQLETIRHCYIRQSLADFTETLYRNSGIYIYNRYVQEWKLRSFWKISHPT